MSDCVTPAPPSEAEFGTAAEMTKIGIAPIRAALVQLGAYQIGKNDRICQHDHGEERASPSHIEHVRLHLARNR